MPAVQLNQKKKKYYRLDVYDEIQSLFEFITQDELSKITDYKTILIQDSVGSELDVFLTQLFDDLDYEILKINFHDIQIKKSDNKDMIKSTLMEEFNQFMEYIIKQRSETLQNTPTQKDTNKEKATDKNDTEDKINNPTNASKSTSNQKPNSTSYLIIMQTTNLSQMSTFNLIWEIYSNFKEELFKKQDVIQNSTPVFLFIFDESTIIPREFIEESLIQIRIPYPNRIQRLEIIDTTLKKMKVHTIDISKLADLTEGWNVRDLDKLINAAYVRWKTINYKEFKLRNITNDPVTLKKTTREKNKPSRLDDTTNAKDNTDSSDITDTKPVEQKSNQKEESKSDIESEKPIDKSKIKESIVEDKKDTNNSSFKVDYLIPFTIDVFEEIIKKKQVTPLREFLNINLISSGQYNEISNSRITSFTAPKTQANDIEGDTSNESKPIKQDLPDMTLIRGSNINELNSFTTNQLYQFAAANNFDDLIKVVEKLDQGKILDDFDRKLLADYSFILRDKPKTALSKLTNAKNRVERLKNVTKTDEIKD